jgi:PhnB protein
VTDVDPLESLLGGDEPVAPDPEFARRLRRRVADALGLPAEVPLADVPTVDLPGRSAPTEWSSAMSTTTSPGAGPASAALPAPALVPYLAVHDADAAMAFYEAAFGAEVTLRFDGDDGRVGHADLVIGPARLFLSDEHPEIGVRSPRTLGGTPVTLHLEVPDVDAAFSRAVAAGATALAEPEDQPYGHRQGTLEDPFGHRWMLSQRLGSVAADELAARMSEQGYRLAGTWVEGDEPASAGAVGSPSRDAVVVRNGRIWPAIQSPDAPALIRLAVDVLGFTEQIVVPGERPDVVAHSQLAWPEGGVVQIASARRDGNPFSEQPPGTASIYVVTEDPMAVYRRCVDAGLEIVREPESPDYDPGGLGFALRDPDGNLWSFGTYAGE